MSDFKLEQTEYFDAPPLFRSVENRIRQIFHEEYSKLMNAKDIAKINSPVYFHLKPEWQDTGKPVRIILHWTGGSYTASSLDKEHYHFLIEGASPPQVIHGKYAVKENDNTGDGFYAAHVRGWNTQSIGVAICAMAGAQERGPYGRFPITTAQFTLAIALCADLCRYYKISPENVMSHFEVPLRGGPKQAGKWDISVVPGMALTGVPLMEYFRSKIIL